MAFKKSPLRVFLRQNILFASLQNSSTMMRTILLLFLTYACSTTPFLLADDLGAHYLDT